MENGSLRLSKDGSPHVTDEIWNTIISGSGALLALLGGTWLIYRAAHTATAWHVVGFLIYGVGLFGLFLMSALHHGLHGSPKTNHLLRQIDYCAIFVMIAGTYTPFCLILMRTALGWGILAVIWLAALIGIAIKTRYPLIHRRSITAFYSGMGWFGVLLAYPVYRLIGWEGLGLLLLGGVLYSAGTFIYSSEKPNPFPGKFGFHEIWHLFVLLGASSHYLLILIYLLPYS